MEPKVKIFADATSGSFMSVALVESTAIRSVTWWKWLSDGKPENIGTLVVTFVNDTRYMYKDVPSEAYAAMLITNSVGSAYNSLVKGKYESVKL